MRWGPLYVVMLAALTPAPLAAAPKAHANAGQKLIQSCDAHKFETVVDVVVDGQPHQSKVKLCGVEGQSDAEWIDTLRDAIKKLQANAEMPVAQREQIMTAIRSEIARLSILTAGPAMPPRSRVVSAIPVEPLSRDYSTLPPLPAPREVGPATVQREDRAELTPMPRASETASSIKDGPGSLSAGPANIPTAAQPVLVRGAAPRLKFGCDTPGDLSSDAPCAEFERDTTINIHAAEDVPAGTLLRFVRNDEPRADVALDGLRRGRTLRVALPAKVCAGFTSGKLELRIVNDSGGSEPQPLSSDGPYSLRC